MPSILTHYFFINDCLDNYDFLLNDKSIALLGAQGTDPFYFYGNLLKHKDKNDINNFASHIHNDNPLNLYIHFINEAYKDMYNIQNILYSKHGFKKWILHTFMKNSQVDNTSMPLKIKDGIDYLNLNKNLWQHPTKNFKMSLSLLELMDYAKKEFNKIKKILLNAYNHLDYENDLESFINNINHSGIIIGDKMLYSNPVF